MQLSAGLRCKRVIETPAWRFPATGRDRVFLDVAGIPRRAERRNPRPRRTAHPVLEPRHGASRYDSLPCRFRSAGNRRMARIAALRAGKQGSRAGQLSAGRAERGGAPRRGRAAVHAPRRPTSTRSRPTSSRPTPAIARSSGASRASSAGTRWRWWSRANRDHDGIGGHISTYASAATLYEVAFNHFFRGKGDDYAGDQVYFQGHASPGMYARAFLEGRLTRRAT